MNVEQLEITNKELESFSYSVSHDLRAPLRAIHGNATIIKEDIKLDTEASQALEKILRNSQRMDQLIDDLLALSKVGKTEIRKSETNMEDLVRRSISELSESIKHRAAIKINTLPPVVADRALLEQVWTNLISNAIKYSGKKESPEIEIGSKHKDNLVVYYIKDNGVGFDMQYVHKLFDTFQRLHRAIDFEGTGIGLAIVKRIITLHNGRIWAEAKPDHGATFYFSLPVQ
jgi:light-regulated signal transduction histidine kinase (bacteriophytochrome)